MTVKRAHIQFQGKKKKKKKTSSRTDTAERTSARSHTFALAPAFRLMYSGAPEAASPDSLASCASTLVSVACVHPLLVLVFACTTLCRRMSLRWRSVGLAAREKHRDENMSGTHNQRADGEGGWLVMVSSGCARQPQTTSVAKSGSARAEASRHAQHSFVAHRLLACFAVAIVHATSPTGPKCDAIDSLRGRTQSKQLRHRAAADLT